jgi:hypothetical protein
MEQSASFSSAMADDASPQAGPSNRLPTLAAEIRQAHADVQEAAKTAAERAIAAGHRLIEARSLVKHGEWLPWLRDHCALADRTAQLYMQLARKGVEPAIVADLGLQAAAKALIFHYGFYSPMADGDDDQRRDWLLFALWRRIEGGVPVGGMVNHTNWLGRKGFKSPDEWLGPEGQKWAARIGMRGGGEGLLTEWHAFKSRNDNLPLAEIERELQRFAENDPEPSFPKKRRRPKGLPT